MSFLHWHLVILVKRKFYNGLLNINNKRPVFESLAENELAVVMQIPVLGQKAGTRQLSHSHRAPVFSWMQKLVCYAIKWHWGDITRLFRLYSSYPFGLLLCHLQESAHISLMPYCASHPSSSFAFCALE